MECLYVAIKLQKSYEQQKIWCLILRKYETTFTWVFKKSNRMRPFTPKMRHFNDYPKRGKYKLQLFMLILFSISDVINNFRMVYKDYKLLLFFVFLLSQQTVKYIKYRYHHRPVTMLTYKRTEHYLMTQVSEKDYFNTIQQHPQFFIIMYKHISSQRANLCTISK